VLDAARRRQYGELFLFLRLVFNNKSMNKKIAVSAIVIYTVLNMYVFGSFVFREQWWSYMIAPGLSGGGIIVFSLLISLFLNAALIIYYSKKYE